ncbi:hypothetical protein HBI46_080550 [Parastagonospora nodorum]|nr:hypothetical protein HBH71_084500 [Parastagonospora nodorum]KAH5420898.1 hypothetical protein HBI46_080550 [Parastagonospora nodorum]
MREEATTSHKRMGPGPLDAPEPRNVLLCPKLILYLTTSGGPFDTMDTTTSPNDSVHHAIRDTHMFGSSKG